MDTNKFDQFTSEIDTALSEGKKIYDKELKCFSNSEELPDELREEIEINVKLSNSHNREIILFFIDAILNKEATTDESDILKHAQTGTGYRGGRGGGNSFITHEATRREELYKRISAEINELKKHWNYKAELNNLTGDARKQKALKCLIDNYIPDFMSFTIQDAQDGKHLQIIEAKERIVAYNLWNHYSAQYQRDKYKSELLEIENNFIVITGEIKKSYELLYPQMIREFRKNVQSAGNIAEKIEVIEFYESEFNRQLDSIIKNRDIARLIEIENNPDFLPLKETIRLQQLSIDMHYSGQLLRFAENYPNKKKSYFFYVYLANSLYQILEPITSRKKDLIKLNEAQSGKTISKKPGIQKAGQSIILVRHVALFYTYLILSNTKEHFTKQAGNVRENIKKLNVDHGFTLSENTIYIDFLKVFQDKKERIGDSETKKRGNLKAINNLEATITLLTKHSYNDALQMANTELSEAK